MKLKEKKCVDYSLEQLYKKIQKKKMSFIANWFWSTKPVEKGEQDKMREIHASIFKELNEVFKKCELSSFAERKYDYDDVYDLLTLKMYRVDCCYVEATWGKNGWVFSNEAKREECRKASEDYFDSMVEYKEFMEDHPILRIPIAKKIFDFAKNEKFIFSG